MGGKIQRPSHLLMVGRLLLVVSLALLSFSTIPSGCHAASEEEEEVLISCSIGWGSSSNQQEEEKKKRVIPSEWMNDGYCDCPFDGLDEPNTDACSGSIIGGWPGVQASVEDSRSFACPQQPKLKLSPSKLNDGICDCCDGADEQQQQQLCPDICNEVLAEERALRVKAEKDFSIGYEKRNQDLITFQKKVKESMDKVSELEHEISSTLQTNDLTATIEGYKKAYAQQRMATAKKLVAGDEEGEEQEEGDGSSSEQSLLLKQLVDPLTTEELVALIVHICQMAGEIETVEEEDTCVALRLAGVDMGLIWDDIEYFDRPVERMTVQRLDGESSLALADLLYQNAAATTSSSDKKPSWILSNIDDGNGGGDSASRRRLDEISPDDDEYAGDGGEEEDDYMGDYGDDYGMYDEEDEYDHHRQPSSYNRNKYKSKHTAGDIKGKRKEMMEEIKSTIFSKTTRMPFMTRSEQLNEELSKILEPKEDEEDDEEKGVEHDEEEDEEDADDDEEEIVGEEDEESSKDVEEETEKVEEEEIETQPAVDPMAYSMVRSTLRRKEEWITRGYKWAASAKFLLSALESSSSDKEEYRKELSGLAVGSLYHSQLKAEHVWQILQTILPELSKALPGLTTEEEQQSQTCAAPWATLCPPQTVTRKSSSWGGSTATLPPAFLKEAAESLCAAQIDGALEASASCGAEAGGELPTSLPETYYGYEIVKPRSDEDTLSQLFASMDTLDVHHAEVEALEKERDDLESRREKLQKEIMDLLREIGGRNQKGLGRDGELYALKDTCHEVTAGKYTYEVCLFGKAAQKDRGQTKSQGTSLGRWTKMEYNPVTGQRVLKWEQGAKCWNGPARSATVFLTCGAENKVLSAEEPETCKYVLQMESYIACDDVFRERVGL